MYTTLIEVAYLVKEEPYSLLASYLPIVPTYQIFENRDRKNSHSWTTHCAVCSFVFSINSKIKSIFFFFITVTFDYLFPGTILIIWGYYTYLFSVFQSPSIFQRKFWREKVPFSEFGKVGYYLLMVIPVNLPNSEEGFFVWIITPQIATELGNLVTLNYVQSPQIRRNFPKLGRHPP